MADTLNLLPCPIPGCIGDIVGMGRLPCGVSTVGCGRCGLSVPATDDESAEFRWNALARRASSAAAVPVDALPPLPEHVVLHYPVRHSPEHYKMYTEAQMQAYARAAVEADRARQQDMSVRLAGAPAGQHDAELTKLRAAAIALRDEPGLSFGNRVQVANDFMRHADPALIVSLIDRLSAATRCRAEGGDGAPEAGDFSADRAQQGEPHDDDIAWEHFASATKAKMAEGREKGRGGWEDPEQCPTERLQLMLLEHLKKGDPVDVANFCMMLWTRGEPVVAVDLKAARQAVLEDAAAICDNFAKRDMHPAECAGAIRMMKDSIK